MGRATIAEQLAGFGRPTDEQIAVAGFQTAHIVTRSEAGRAEQLDILQSVSRYLLGLSDPVADNVSANVIGLGLGTLARFWALRRFIFLTPAGVERRRAAAASRPLDRVGCS